MVTVALPLAFTAPAVREPSSNIATLTPVSRSPSQEQPTQVKKSA
jgi:cell cycle sensor histidine kinase DivJ